MYNPSLWVTLTRSSDILLHSSKLPKVWSLSYTLSTLVKHKQRCISTHGQMNTKCAWVEITRPTCLIRVDRVWIEDQTVNRNLGGRKTPINQVSRLYQAGNRFRFECVVISRHFKGHGLVAMHSITTGFALPVLLEKRLMLVFKKKGLMVLELQKRECLLLAKPS